MTRQARLESELPSVVDVKDLDAQTAEALRGSSYSNVQESTSQLGQSDFRKNKEELGSTLEFRQDDIDRMYQPKDLEDRGFWKSPEKDLKGIMKCFYNNWEERQEDAKEKLGDHIDNLVPREHRERMTNIHDAVVEGNLCKLQESIRCIPPDQLKAYLKDINQHLKESGSDVQATVSSTGKVLLFSRDNKSAIEIDPRTGDARERAIVGMTKSIPPQLIFGDVEPGDPKDALGRIGDEVTRDLTFGKEDLSGPILKPRLPRDPFWDRPSWDRPGWDKPIWDKPIWGRPIWEDGPYGKNDPIWRGNPILKDDSVWDRLRMHAVQL